jgi:hypothetical protein
MSVREGAFGRLLLREDGQPVFVAYDLLLRFQFQGLRILQKEGS